MAADELSVARRLAARVLVRVWEEGAFAAPALDGELARATAGDGARGERLDPRDAGLCTELVYGVLRTEGLLEQRILAAAKRGELRLVSPARAHLLIGAYSLLFLDRVPAFAAVSEAVDGVRASDERAAGFANAVLRRLAQDVGAGNDAPPGKGSARPTLQEATAASAPGWLRGSLRRALGRRDAEAYLAAGPVPPPIGLCLHTGEDRDAWVERLRAAAPDGQIDPGKASPRAIVVRGAGDVRRLPGAGEAWIIQEEGSQLVAMALGAGPGERVLDACAGHGNKSWVLGDDVGEAGVVDAADLSTAKLDDLRRAGHRVREAWAVDWTVGSDAVPRDYDRALVDAPCSGTGTLRRRPEIALRRTAEDLPRLAALQLAIVRGVAAHVRHGGRLVFSVCSVLREEAEDVVTALVEGAAAPPELGAPADASVRLVPVPFDSELLAAMAPGATRIRLLPHVHGTDGYFVACFDVHRAVE